jgi:hypothetical protein
MTLLLPVVLLWGVVVPAFGQVGNLPLTFEENQGQASRDGRLVARGKGYTMLLNQRGNRVVLDNGRQRLHLTTYLAGSRASRIRGEEQLSGKANYLHGSDSRRWITGIPTYQRVRSENVYPGIDLVYYRNGSQLEYDFIVRRGGDIKKIAMRFDGLDRFELDSEGKLHLIVGDWEVVHQKPAVYQEIGTDRREIAGGYRIISNTTVGFEIGRLRSSEDAGD